MVQGLYHHLRKNWRNPDSIRVRELMTKWRSEPVIFKIEKPTRLDKARALGYKAKKGFVMVRVRIKRGGKQRERTNKARKPKKHTIRLILKMNYRWVAEQRVQKYFSNLEVLNSYPVGKDGKYYFFEVIMVDYSKPEIINDETINWICDPANRNRVFRGLTSAAKKSRGLRKKSRNMKVRPSLRAWNRLGK